VNLEPNLKKFQACTYPPAEFQAALSTKQNKWLKRTSIITDPALRSQVELETGRRGQGCGLLPPAKWGTRPEGD